MGKAINDFIRNFQDMYVTKRTTIENFPSNISSIELNILNSQLNSINDQLVLLSNLTNKATEENLEEYLRIKEILESKIDYVSEVSNMFLYLNSFYDMDTVVDLKNYNLKNTAVNDSIVFDNVQKGLTLRNVSNTYNCLQTIVNGKSLVYYNTNLAYHTGITLDSPYLDLLDIKSISVRKVDGTILNLPFLSNTNNTQFLKHDYISSTQIIIDLNIDVNALPVEVQDYYKSLKVSLIDYTYEEKGSLVLEQFDYSSSGLFNIIYNSTVPANTYVNLDLNIIGLDINGNRVNSFSTTLGIGSPELCKRLDEIDFNKVKTITSIYIGNKQSTSKKLLDKDYLLNLDNKNEIFVTYLPLNNSNEFGSSYKVLNNQGIRVTDKNINKLQIYSTIEMITFNKNSAPLLKMLTGVTKHV